MVCCHCYQPCNIFKTETSQGLYFKKWKILKIVLLCSKYKKTTKSFEGQLEICFNFLKCNLYKSAVMGQ